MNGFIDLHCDTISVLAHSKEYISLKHNDLQIDLEKLLKAGYLGQCFAIFTFLDQEDPFKDAVKMIECFQKEIKANNKLITQVKTYEEFKENYINNKLAAILTVEDLGIIGEDMAKLEFLSMVGVKIASLTWNFPNSIGMPNINYWKNNDVTIPNNEEGLTDFGFKVIKKMEELKMIIDVSHLGDKGFWDVYNHTTKPFIATHSNARAICNHVRNLSDEMIKALASRGGVIGLNFATPFVNKDAETTTIPDLMKHIKHIIKVGGIDCLALGTDFDGIKRTTFIDNAGMMGLLHDALVHEGFNDDDINKICYNNFLRVLRVIDSE